MYLSAANRGARRFLTEDGSHNRLIVRDILFSHSGDDQMDDFAGGIHTTGLLVPFADPISAANETREDWDFFRVELDPFTEYTFFVVDEPVDSRSYQDVYYYDYEGNYLDQSFNYDGEEHYFRTHGGGRYFVGIRGDIGSYNIRLEINDRGGDTFETAVDADLRGNRYFTGSIFDANDQDWFKVLLKANTTYEFHALGLDSNHGSLPNPALRAWDPMGNWLAGDDNDGTGRNSKFTITTGESGEYHFQVFSAEPGGTGSYHIFSNQLDDYDATLSKLGQLTPNSGGSSGVIDYHGDKDWFEIELVNGNAYEVFSDTGSVRVYDENFRKIGDSQETSELSFFHNIFGSKLYIEAVGVTFEPYVVQVNDIDDFGDHSGVRGFMSPGGSPTFGQLEAGDTDWHRIELLEGGTYEFEVNPTDEYGRLFEGDMNLWLFDSNENLVASSTGPSLAFQAMTSGNHYVSVQGVGGNDGTANGHYRVGGIIIDETGGAIPFVDNRILQVGALDRYTDVDTFEIDLIAGKTYSFYRSSDPYDRREDEVWNLQRPDAIIETFGSRSSYSDRFETTYFEAPVTGTYTVVENGENNAGPASYRYEIDQDSYRPVIANGAKLIEDSFLVSDYYSTAYSAQIFEVHSTIELMHSGSVVVPANTEVALTDVEFETLGLASGVPSEAFDVSVRAQQPNDEYNSWTRINIVGIVPPEALIPDPNALPETPNGYYSRTVRFSFAETLPSYYADGEIVGFQPLAPNQVGGVHRAHGRWNSNLLPVVRVGANQDSDIVVFRADITEDVMVFAPGDGKGHDIVISSSSPVMQNITPGSEGFYKVLRAIGQAVGFSEQPALDGSKTLMGTLDPAMPFPRSPLIWDITAMQRAYGIGIHSPRIQDTALNSNGSEFFNLAEFGELDGSESTHRVHIDLLTGQESYVDDPSGTYKMVTGFKFTSNATGSNFDDWIAGGLYSNTLQGLDGNDRLMGRHGNDLLRGGLGDDTYVYRAGEGQDQIEDMGDGTDTLLIEGLSNLTSLDDDLTFERLGGDMLIRLEWDSLNYPNSDRILIKGMDDIQNRVEKLVLSNPVGEFAEISLASVFDQLTEYRQRFEVAAGSDAYGSLVSPVS